MVACAIPRPKGPVSPGAPRLILPSFLDPSPPRFLFCVTDVTGCGIVDGMPIEVMTTSSGGVVTPAELAEFNLDLFRPNKPPPEIPPLPCGEASLEPP